MPHDYDFVPYEEIAARAGPGPNPHLTIIVRPDADPARLRFGVADFGGNPHWRVTDTMAYLRDLRARLIAAGTVGPLLPRAGEDIVFQADDNAFDLVSISWESRRTWSAVRLVPDIYYYQARGYADYLPALPAWEDRPARFVWRGSSTGLLGFEVWQLDMLPRYRLCASAVAFGHADVGITDVVQAITPADEAAVRARLGDEGLLASFVQMDALGASGRYIFDIDGNANSWNFMAKLRLGCCVLRVESGWKQWFDDRIVAWRHYVPVREDLSDLHEKMHWCLVNPADAGRIAEAGRRFALNMAFDAEIDRAARVAFAEGS